MSRKKARSLSRRKAFRDPAPRVLILTEGAETEPRYFDGVLRVLKLLSVTTRGPCGVPRTMVQTAVAEKERYDEIWCVFDVDSHPHLADAIQQASAHGIRVALSNPCFEIFLLLHQEYYSRPCTRDEVRRRLKRHLPGYDKLIDFNYFWPRYPAAQQNNQRLTSWHASRGTAGAAPSTRVVELIERLREFRQKFDGSERTDR